MGRLPTVLSMAILLLALALPAGTSSGDDGAIVLAPKAPSIAEPVIAKASGSRRGAKRASRPRATVADVSTLESHVAARMPRHDRGFHRQLAAAIHQESRHAGLDPLLVLALIHVESSFDPGAVSEAGARGLMQLRETTLRRELQRSGIAADDPLDPIVNVRAGIRYLQRLVRAFGSTDVALMAYNAGPNRILSYHRAGGIPDRFLVYPRRIRGELERLRVRGGAGATRSRSPVLARAGDTTSAGSIAMK